MKRAGFFWVLMLVVCQISFGATPTKTETSANPKCPGPLHTHEETKNCIFDIKYPTLSNPEMECKIRSWIDQYVKENGDGPELDPEAHQKNALWIKPEVYRSKNTESVLLEIYEYAQGAHGETSVKTFVYDVKTGKEFSLFDILDRGRNWTKKLHPSIDKLLNEPDSSVIIGTDGRYLDSFKHCVVDGNELVIAFDQCEAGPCSNGIVRLHVPMKDIRYVLKPGFADLYYSK